MYRRLAFYVLALSCSILAGCATPDAMKQASSLQLEAFANTEQSVASYVDLVDKEIQSIQALRMTSSDLTAVVTAVETVAADPQVTEKPVTALDSLASQITLARRSNAGQPDSLGETAKQHRENLQHLKELLLLLQQNQELINLYLNTDLGPSEEQINGLSSRLTSLKQLEPRGGL